MLVDSHGATAAPMLRLILAGSETTQAASVTSAAVFAGVDLAAAAQSMAAGLAAAVSTAVAVVDFMEVREPVAVVKTAADEGNSFSHE